MNITVGSIKQKVQTFGAAATKAVRRFSRLYRNELDKYFTVKLLLPFLLLSIILAAITVPINNYVNPPYEYKTPVLTERQQEVLNELEQKIAEFAIEFPDYKNDEILLRNYNKLVKEYELYKAESLWKDSSPYEKESYILFIMYFVLALYLFQVVFSALTVREDYRHKTSLSMFTSPAGRSNLFLSKFSLNMTFAVLIDSVFFLIIAICMAGYQQYEPVFLLFAYTPVRMTAQMTLFCFYLMTLLSSVFVVSATMAGALWLKNNFLVIPAGIGLFCFMPFLLSAYPGDPATYSFLPIANMLFIPESIAEYSLSYVGMNTPTTAVVSLLLSSAIFLAAGYAGYRFRQHKE